MRRLILASALVAVVPALAADKELPLLFEDDFAKGDDRWQPKDPEGWKVVDADKGKAYSQFEKKSSFKPPHRSPFHVALVKDLLVGDCVLEAKVKSTIPDYGHRDACVFFGYQDDAHLYYVHLGKKTDDHANQIFIVNKADRVKISTKTTDGTPWTDNWHRVKVVRTVADGKIAVYFDDMDKPVMEATDKTFAWGQVGVGSFDDTTNWTEVKVRGVKAERPK